MNAAKAKLTAFTSWANRQINAGQTGAAGPLDSLDFLRKWLEAVSRENAGALEQLRNDLEQCRMVDWSRLEKLERE